MHFIIAITLAALSAMPTGFHDTPGTAEPAVELEFAQPADLSYKVNDPVTYKELLYQAVFNCRGINPNKIDYALLDKLIEVEKSFNPPPGMRGMILAAACMESGYNPNARGDRKFSKNKKTPMAIGILQMWPIYEKMFPGLNRTDPKTAAESWMKHIVRQIPKVKKMCKYKTEDKIWLAAWVTGIRSKKVGGRCKQRPNHYKILKKWHRDIKRNRKKMLGC